MSKVQTGKKHSEETKLKFKNRPRFECIYCKKLYSKQALGQHHNERCKLKY